MCKGTEVRASSTCLGNGDFITIILGARCIYPHLRDGKTETQGDEVDNSHPT